MFYFTILYFVYYDLLLQLWGTDPESIYGRLSMLKGS